MFLNNLAIEEKHEIETAFFSSEINGISPSLKGFTIEKHISEDNVLRIFGFKFARVDSHRILYKSTASGYRYLVFAAFNGSICRSLDGVTIFTSREMRESSKS